MKNYDFNKKTIQSVVLILIMGFSAMYFRYTWLIISAEQSEQVIQIARSIAAVIHKEDLKKLEAKPSDIEKPQYQLIKNTLKEVIRINSTARFAYLYTQLNGKIYFFADSEPVDSKEYSPPGQECLEANVPYKQIFKDGKDCITEPVSDRWGKWISVLIPIRDNRTNKIIAVYGMDFSVSSWNNRLLYELTESSVLIVLLFFALLYLFKTKIRNRSLSYDINKLKLTEEALRKSEEKYRLIFENVQEVFFQTDPTGIVIELSPSFKHFSEYNNVEIIGKSVNILYFNPEDRHALIDKIMNNGELRDYELKLKTKAGEGRLVSVNARLIFDSYGKPSYIVGAIRDINERKQAEEKLQNERLLLRTLIDYIPDSIYSKDINFRKTLANLTELKYAGVKSEDELLGKDDFDIYPAELAEKFFADDQMVIKTGIPVLNREEFLFDDKGQQRWLLSSKIPLRDRDDRIIGLVGIGRDITERIQAEKEIKLKNIELQKINAEKDKFFSIIAHDLRSPLGGFMRLTELLSDDNQDFTPEEIKDITLTLSRSSRNIFNLLENLLEWSLMQQGKIPFKPQILVLQDVISDCVKIFAESAGNKFIDITVNVDKGMKAFADKNMLQTVIRNLVSNAIKFTGRGGKVTISATTDENNKTVIAVKDTGIGMSIEMVEDIFRLDGNTNRAGTEGESSTGLGLLLCKEFVEKNGGILGAKSEPGLGSIFYFTIG